MKSGLSFDFAVHVPPKAVVRAMLEELLARLPEGPEQPNVIVQTSALRPDALPAFGATWNGGLFAGITVHDNKPMALILLPGDESLNWKDATAWAEKAGGYLPTRFDQLVLLQNLKSEFQAEYYWSSVVHTGNADYADCAWIQSFGTGYQYGARKDNDYRARAVRRVAI